VAKFSAYLQSGKTFVMIQHIIDDLTEQWIRLDATQIMSGASFNCLAVKFSGNLNNRSNSCKE